MKHLFQALFAPIFLSIWIVVAALSISTGPVFAAPAPIVISPPHNYEFIRPIIGLPYTGQFTATGGTGTLRFEVSGLPSEMAMSVDGLLTGTLLTPYTTRAITVTVTDDDGSSESEGYTFYTLALPIVSSMSPTSGPATGGTEVTVSGYSLDGASVMVDGAAVTPSHVGTDTVRFTTPAHAAGAVSVEIIAQNSLAGTETFTYTAQQNAPTLSAITPSEKLVTANMFKATITGTNLSSVDHVVVGAIWVPLNQIEVISDTTIKFITPSNLPGIYDVTVVTANGQATLNQAFTVKVPPSTDATLSDLAVSDGTLSPAFAADTINYTTSVASGVSSVKVTPTVTDANAIVTVAGTPVASGAASGPLTLSLFGTTSIPVVVKAEDGTIKTYTIVVSRLMPQIQSVTPASGPVAGGTTVVIMGANLGDATGVTFGGVAGTDFHIDNDGQITVTTPAASADGSVDVRVLLFSGGYIQQNAAFTYGAPQSANARLSALTFSAGLVDPAFSPDTTTYTVTVPHDTSEIRVTATTADPGASLSIRDTTAASGTPFGPISLNVGDNKVGIRVLAENRNTDTGYYVTVHREAAPSVIVLSPADGSLTGGKVGTAYAGMTVVASGGTAPYGYTVTTGKLPAGLSINTATGEIAGTPEVGGDYSFTVTATDATNLTGSAHYTLKVAENPNVAFTFTPPAGALPEAMGGEPYTQTIEAKGGAAPLTWTLASGRLPDGLVLNAGSGQLSGTISEKAVGPYDFTLQVKDVADATGAVSYTLKVVPRKVTVADKEIDVPPGSTPTDVRLDSGATGGPFTSADLTRVEPANAGTATITWGDYAQAGPTSGPVGWYLKFVPDPAFSGTVRVGFRLTSALGVSNTGTVSYKLGYDADKVAADIDALVHGFVQTRQNLLLSSIKVPGLLERRQMGLNGDPVTTRLSPSGDGMTLGFSTSLAQLDAAHGAIASPFNIWIDGALLVHNREENGARWGSFGLVSLGADYLVTEKALVGLTFHFDRMSDPTKEDAELTGNGWLGGPYASLEIARNVFWNTSLLYGGSANDIDTTFWDGSFDTTRWMIDTSITGQWRLDDVTTLTPMLRAVYFSEKVDDYAVKNSTGDELGLDGFTEQQFRVSLGAEIARSFTLENDAVLTPKLGLTGGFSGLDGSGLFGTATVGLSLGTSDAWMFDASLLFNLASEDEQSGGVKVGLSRRF